MGTRLRERLIDLIEGLKAEKRLSTFDEAATKQGVVLRLLSDLGWDTYNVDEVKPEYPVGGRKIDYSLRTDRNNRVFLEVKKVEEDLEKHQEQLLNYSFKEGVRLAVLTNGITWWFYLPLLEGSWEQRRFYAIDIYKQEAADIASRFIGFLSKEAIESGEAHQNAQRAYERTRRSEVIREALPEAWNRILHPADETLIELIGDMTESLCGYKPDSDMIDRFLARHKDQFLLAVKVEPKPRKKRRRAGITRESYTGKSISAFRFLGAEYKVDTWKELLLRLSGILLKRHKEDFVKVLSLKGRKRPYFTRNADELRSPEKVSGTSIFVEMNLSSNSIVKICFDLLTLFEYPARDFNIVSP